MPPTTRQQSRTARVIPRFERLVTRAFERQRTMEDGWRTFSEAYLINPERIKRKQIARQRFAASIRRVIFLRLSVREIITYLGLNTQFGACDLWVGTPSRVE